MTIAPLQDEAADRLTAWDDGDAPPSEFHRYLDAARRNTTSQASRDTPTCTGDPHPAAVASGTGAAAKGAADPSQGGADGEAAAKTAAAPGGVGDDDGSSATDAPTIRGQSRHIDGATVSEAVSIAGGGARAAEAASSAPAAAGSAGRPEPQPQFVPSGEGSGGGVSVRFAPSVSTMVIADLVLRPDGGITVAVATEEASPLRDPRRVQTDAEDLRRRLEARGAPLGELQVDGQRIALNEVGS